MSFIHFYNNIPPTPRAKRIDWQARQDEAGGGGQMNDGGGVAELMTWTVFSALN